MASKGAILVIRTDGKFGEVNETAWRGANGSDNDIVRMTHWAESDTM
ncbi:MAG: hypothetical protein ABJO54_05015 [Hyphomicrobiales bacterium]